MKGLTSLFRAFIIIISIASCSVDDAATKSESADVSSTETSKPKEISPPKVDENQQAAKPNKPQTEWSLADLSFDNGMKWKANIETSQAIESMDDAMDVFLLTEEHTLKEYNEFAALLQIKYQTIFNVCTMRGAGHDELDKMLVKVNFYLEKMASEDIDEVKKGCDQLHKQLHLYNVYFE